MINTLKRWAPVMAAMFTMAAPAFSQAPTDAQRNAIRSECRSDYEAHCSSIPPGGEASLQCLQKNMSSLSSGCAGAVRAVDPAAAPKAETAPAAAPKAETEPPKPAATTAAPAAAPKAAAAPAKKPTDAQVSAIRSACRSDYQKVCAGVPTGGSAALQCLDKNKAKVSGGCQQALNAVGGGATPAAAAPANAAPGTAPATATAAPATAVIVLRPMLPREEFFVLRSACGADVRTLCAGVAPGGGRIVQCLATQAASISPACKDVLAPFAAR